MLKYVVKRDGRIDNFQSKKIQLAILNGLIVTYTNRKLDELKKLSEVICDKVVFNLSQTAFTNEEPTVEEIQDVVEDTLIEMGEKRTAKQYILYRFKHKNIREGKHSLIDSEKIINEYVNQHDWKVKENSNMGFSLQGLNNHLISEVTRSFWLNQIYNEPIGSAHSEGDIHIHDLGLLSTYCCGWSLEDLLLKGFGGVEGKIESNPAKHLKTAMGQMVNFFYTLQGEAAGAQAFSSFDTYLAPFVRLDKLNYAQVRQTMQEFIFNLNVPTRVGFQTPFVNLTMDLQCPSTIADTPIIIGGEYVQEYTYKDFQPEMDMINKAFCEVMMDGDAKGRIFTFPIPTYNITKDFNWDCPIIDKVAEMTAKYGIPYFANYVNSDMSPEDARSMCCRLRLDNRELRKRGGGLFGANPLTGSIGVVTINLPRLGYLYKSENDFFENLRRLMDLSKYSLETKRKVIEKNTDTGLYPYSKHYLEAVYSRFNQYWKNHFSTIGLNGMNECILNFYNGKENITTEIGQEFSNKILDFMRDIISDYQVETGNLYNLEATPAEGTGYRLARLDTKKYPDIITSGEDSPYYTNSTQLPVDFTSDIFEALDLQEDFQCKYTGGTVFHGFLGEKITDIETCKSLIKKVMTNYKIPYFTISPTFSVCPDHGYISGEHFNCPQCNKDAEVWTRVVGFHRPVNNWNKGKRSEFKDRKEFVI